MNSDQDGTRVTISRLKELAKELKRSRGIKHVDALDQVARAHGFDHWHAVTLQLQPEGWISATTTAGSAGKAQAGSRKLRLLPTMLLHDRGELDAFSATGSTMEVSSRVLGTAVIPAERIILRQPMVNPMHVIACAGDSRNGWEVVLPDGIDEFDLRFDWSLQVGGTEEAYMVSHRLTVKLEAGGKYFSMETYNWPRHADMPRGATLLDIRAMAFPRGDGDISRWRKVKHSVIVDDDVGSSIDGTITVYEEEFFMPGLTKQQYEEDSDTRNVQLREVKAVRHFTTNIEQHQRNAIAEMPRGVFIEAVHRARDGDWRKWKPAGGVRPGYLESHPAIRVLRNWWKKNVPGEAESNPGWAMVSCRVGDDGNYWADLGHEGAAIWIDMKDLEQTRKSQARCGDFLLITMFKSQAFSKTDGKTVFSTTMDGAVGMCANGTVKGFDAAQEDFAVVTLGALEIFPERYQAAWDAMQRPNEFWLVDLLPQFKDEQAKVGQRERI